MAFFSLIIFEFVISCNEDCYINGLLKEGRVQNLDARSKSQELGRLRVPFYASVFVAKVNWWE